MATSQHRLAQLQDAIDVLLVILLDEEQRTDITGVRLLPFPRIDTTFDFDVVLMAEVPEALGVHATVLVSVPTGVVYEQRRERRKPLFNRPSVDTIKVVACVVGDDEYIREA